MMKKLPINVNPIIKGYVHHAFPFSIISINEDYVPWMSNYFIQIRCNPNILEKGGHPFDFLNDYSTCPFLKARVMPKFFANNYIGGIVGIIKDAINNNPEFRKPMISRIGFEPSGI